MLSRRTFLTSSAVMTTAGLVGLPAFAADTKTLQVYVDGDTNISDWWNNILKPAFEAANPGWTFNVTITRGVGDGNATIAQRALAAMQSKSDPQVDYFEEFDPADVAGSIEAGLWTNLTVDNVPNLKMVNPAAVEAA